MIAAIVGGNLASMLGLGPAGMFVLCTGTGLLLRLYHRHVVLIYDSYLNCIPWHGLPDGSLSQPLSDRPGF